MKRLASTTFIFAIMLVGAVITGCQQPQPIAISVPQVVPTPVSTPMPTSPSKNMIKSIRSVPSAIALEGKAGVEIEVTSDRVFPVRNEIVVLHIGDKEFMYSRYPDNGDIRTLIFILTAGEFAETATGDPVSVYYGLGGGGPGDKWDFGPLDKSRIEVTSPPLPSSSFTPTPTRVPPTATPPAVTASPAPAQPTGTATISTKPTPTMLDSRTVLPSPTSATPTSTASARAMPVAAPTAGATPATYDKFALWTKGTQLRGANIYQRKVYPNVYDDPEAWGNGPLGPVFTQQDFDALAAAGANFVVLSHPGLYDDKPPYAFNSNVQDNLDRFIAMAGKANLFVVITFRTGPGRSEFTFFAQDDPNDTFAKSHLNDDVWKDRQAQDKWVEMWRNVAIHYRGSQNVVGYELMAEPNSNGAWLNIFAPADFYPGYENTTYDWNQMYPRISKAIREVDSETPILIGGLGWSQVRWLPYLKPTDDKRTVYIIHQYEPQDQYTHQRVTASGALPNQYPGRFDTNGDGVVRDFNKAWIHNLLGIVDAFKTNYGVPVGVTEYGAIRWVPGVDQFIDDEMATFDESGINYAIWSWQPASKAFNAAQNEFNFRLGPDPANLTEGISKMYDALKKYWAKNKVRPSDFR